MSGRLLVAEHPAFTSPKPVISVNGLNPWDYHWDRPDEPEIIFPDSTLPSRGRWMRIYEIGEPNRRVRFAAELHDRTWSFYVLVPPGTPGSLSAISAEYEGHWRDSADEKSELPWPSPAPEWLGRPAFLKCLDEIEATAERILYRGKSLCRLCGCINGHEAFRLDGWEWPAGYRHYIAEHLVRPSQQFEEFTLARS